MSRSKQKNIEALQLKYLMQVGTPMSAGERVYIDNKWKRIERFEFEPPQSLNLCAVLEDGKKYSDYDDLADAMRKEVINAFITYAASQSGQAKGA